MSKTVLLLLVLGSATAAADSYKDQHQKDLDEALERTNKMCGTKLTLAPVDWAAWEKAGAKAQDCRPILDAVRDVCSGKKGEPHPAAQAFVKDKLKSFRCTLLPDNNKSEEKVSIQDGVVTFARVPQYSPSGQVARLLITDAAFAGLANARREWDIENVDAPKAAESLKKSCGDDMTLTIDIASWRLAGKDGASMPTAIDVGEMCKIYASGVAELCGDDKAGVRKQLDGIRCAYSKAIKSKATVGFKGRDVIVSSGVTIGFGDGAIVREAVEKKLGKKPKKK